MGDGIEERKLYIQKFANFNKTDNFEIEFFHLSDGCEPAKEFISSLEPKMKAKTLKILDILLIHMNMSMLKGISQQHRLHIIHIEQM